MSDQSPQRVRVTSPRPVVRRRRRPVASEIDAHTEVGEIYMASLLGAQLRLAILVLVPLAGIGFGLPLLMWAFPALVQIRVGGFPLTWVMVALAVYPIFVALGWFYVRAAERTERDFTAAVED